jgi:hypothetical protein
VRFLGAGRAAGPRRALALAATLTLLLGGGTGSPAAAEAVVRSGVVVQSGAAEYAPVSASSYALATSRLPDGRRVVLRWNPCQVITYTVNVTAVPAARRTALATEIRTAVGRLGEATRVVYSYRGMTSSVPRSTNVTRQGAELVVAVTTASATDFDIGDGVLGYGGYRYWQWTTTSSSGRRTSGAAIARGWVVLDVTGLMRLTPGFGPGNTRGNVMLHELAHTAGLNHVSDARQLLYPTLSASAPNGYASGDRAGLGKVGLTAGCITVPSNVVTDLR